ncbi:MAG TPA: Zn-dependent hydrolase [Vicinamibacterales bacterium]|nr:Zn-dependent hydrolase [Vicinamibacterales bacterium]
MKRRDFLHTMASAAVAAAAPLRAQSTAPRIDAARLRQEIEALSAFGRPAGGSFADGVSRTAYSDADIQGRAYAIGLMRGAGLNPRIDPAGNIFAVRAGQDATLRPILFGSHIDSVPQGGNFDGDLGSLAAIETIRALDAARIVTRHPLEVVIWAHEEGGTFPNGLNGSRAAAGQLVAGEMDQIHQGLRKADGIRRIGGDPDRIAGARRQPGTIHCYLELHIEQGGTLDRRRVQIGVVEGIVSISRYRATVSGFANHAGTTMMADRQDALIAASQVVLAVREEVTRVQGPQVGTVGRLDVTPNAANVIPGRAELTIELRDLSEAKLASIADAIASRARAIASATKTTIEIAPTGHYGPALATPSVQSAIERAAAGLGFTHTRLPSGAGHDAQMAATLGPMGMIFVPSIGGISHSPKERTEWDDCARGADVLLRTVLEVDRLTL